MSRQPARWIAGAAAGVILCAGGCGVVGPSQTAPNDFYSQPAPAVSDVRPPNDQGGFIAYNGGSVAPAQAPQGPMAPPDVPISGTVQRASTQPAVAGTGNAGSVPSGATTGPATLPLNSAIVANPTEPNAGPATVPASAIGPGQYMVIGAVIASVNNTPIYANKVVEFLEPELRAKARDPEMTADRFRNLAMIRIPDEVDKEISQKLLITAATQILTDEQKARARAMTVDWYERQITDAGGSLELARQRAAASGTDLDTQTEATYETFMFYFYWQYTLYPHINVTVQMMRDYYEANKGSQFTLFDHAEFYLIEVSPARMPGADQQAREAAALEKIKHLRDQANGGTPFQQLAAQNNDDSGFMDDAKASRPISVNRHSLRLVEVDQAVFSLQPKQVSDIISSQGNYYLAEVESRTIGKTLPFDDPVVQKAIDDKLHDQQLAMLRDKENQKLRSEAAVSTYPEMYDAALQMVMQNYPIWRANTGH